MNSALKGGKGKTEVEVAARHGTATSGLAGPGLMSLEPGDRGGPGGQQPTGLGDLSALVSHSPNEDRRKGRGCPGHPTAEVLRLF